MLVAEDGGQAVGWAVGWQVPDELHLMNVSGQLAIRCVLFWFGFIFIFANPTDPQAACVVMSRAA